jgi:hypothetical protein
MKTIDGKRVAEITHKETQDLMRAKSQLDRYPFSLLFTFEAGKEELKDLSKRPVITFRPEHLVSNVRETGIATLVSCRGGNIECILQDGLDLNALPEGEDPILGVPVRFPQVPPQNYITMRVHYTGRIPAGYKAGDPLLVDVTLVGSGAL